MKKNILLVTLVITVWGIMPCNLFSMNDDPNYYTWVNEDEAPSGHTKKSPWEEEREHLHDSDILDDKTLTKFFMDVISNCEDQEPKETMGLLLSAVNEYSLPTQFDSIEDSIHTAIALNKITLANMLYEQLIYLYTNYLLDDSKAAIYYDRCLHLAKVNPQLESHKLPSPNAEKKFKRIDGLRLGKQKYFITEVQSPRQKKTEKVQKQDIEDYRLTYYTEVSLQTSSPLVFMKGTCVLAAKRENEIDCYFIQKDSEGTWEKTLGFRGFPILFCPPTQSREMGSLRITELKHLKTSIISSLSNPSLCAYFAGHGDEIPPYLLEGTRKGALIKYDLPNNTSEETPGISKQNKTEFSEQHKGPITALLALKKYAYSASQDRSLKKWDIPTGSCLNRIDELEDTIKGLAYFQGHLIALLPQKIVLFDLDKTPPTTLALYTLPQEKGESWTALTSFNDELLLAGTNMGQLKICNSRDGFNNAGNLSISAKPIKSLVNIDDKHLLIHHQAEQDHIMILSKASKFAKDD